VLLLSNKTKDDTNGKTVIVVDGQNRKFSGTADQVIVDATNGFKNSTTAAGMNPNEISNFVSTKIALPALKKMGNNITKAKKSNALETDANNRAANKLGAGTIRYNNTSAPINYNGIPLKNK
jgi:hypothetical protein